LTFFTTFSIYFLYLAIREPRGGRRLLYYPLAYLGMAFGFLTKLQPAVIVPLLAIGAYALWRRRLRVFLLDYAHLLGIGCFLLVAGGWLFLAWKEGGGGYLNGLLLERTALTFFKTHGHLRPPYYYLLRFPADFLPWSIFLPSAVISSWREKREETLLLLLWFGTVFIFFSLAKAKRELYLLPIYPASALLVGYLWAHLPQGDWPKLLRWPTILLALISLLSGVISPLMIYLFARPYLSNPWEVALVSFFLLGVGGGLILYLYYARPLKRGLIFPVMVAVIFIFQLYGVYKIFPEVNRYKSARPLCERLREEISPRDRVGIYGLEGADFNYYAGIPHLERIEGEERLLSFLRSPQRSLCIMRRRHYERIKGLLPLEVVAEGKVGHRRLVIISNKPPS